jgi:hypothetical protein
VFNANITAAQQAVIQQAINEWTGIITTAGVITNPYPITFLNAPIAGNTLAVATTNFQIASGNLNFCTITIDNDGSSVWWVDPTPGNNVEFDAAGACNPGQPCLGATDLLTVMRHEIGHSLGWTGAFGAALNPLTSGLIAGTTFDAARLNIAMDPALTSHSSGATFPNGLMNPGIGLAMRRAISLYPAASLPARAINHRVIMRYVDGSNTGAENGSADNPWNTFAEALTNEASTAPLLLIGGTYAEVPPSFVLNTARTVQVANGPDAVVN